VINIIVENWNSKNFISNLSAIILTVCFRFFCQMKIFDVDQWISFILFFPFSKYKSINRYLWIKARRKDENEMSK